MGCSLTFCHELFLDLSCPSLHHLLCLSVISLLGIGNVPCQLLAEQHCESVSSSHKLLVPTASGKEDTNMQLTRFHSLSSAKQQTSTTRNLKNLPTEADLDLGVIPHAKDLCPCKKKSNPFKRATHGYSCSPLQRRQGVAKFNFTWQRVLTAT